LILVSLIPIIVLPERPPLVKFSSRLMLESGWRGHLNPSIYPQINSSKSACLPESKEKDEEIVDFSNNDANEPVLVDALFEARLFVVYYYSIGSIVMNLFSG
jgi:hypothetical protein